MLHIDRRAALAGIGMLAVAALSAIATPHRHLAAELAPLDLEGNIPRRLGDWKVDLSIVPILPSADVQQRLDQLYNTVFSRTYVDSRGNRIMFLIAYGTDQADRLTLAHLPEGCYSSQGFQVWPTSVATIRSEGRALEVRRLRTRKGLRVEPVTYWTTVGDRAFIDELGRRMARARYALKGIVPDGMLVRVSSIDEHEAEAFERQSDFISALFSGLPAATRVRLFGLPS